MLRAYFGAVFIFYLSHIFDRSLISKLRNFQDS